MIRFLFALAVIILAGQLAACNTVEGFGRDLNRAGSAISNAAN
jgi:predicted small secreted protein